MHEQSETEERDGRWVNVYGRATAKAGQVLKPREDYERESYDTVEEAVRAAERRSEDSPKFHYADRGAAEVTKAAKHDPATESVVHAAHRRGPHVSIHTERWGRSGPVKEHLDPKGIPVGSAATIRGQYRPDLEEIDIRRGADEAHTLGHELGHTLSYQSSHKIGRVGPYAGQEEEALANYMAREPRQLLTNIQRKEDRDRLKGIARDLLGKDIKRGGEVDLSERPSYVDRLNASLREERETAQRKAKRPTRQATRGGSRR